MRSSGTRSACSSATGVRLLWGTACLFAHPRFMAGAGTSPSVGVFAHAAAQVKKAIEVTHRLGGEGYVFWGGREGYDTLLNTDMRRESSTSPACCIWRSSTSEAIGFTGQFYIEPKPCEPTTHQYDYDAQSCHAFLLRHGLAGTSSSTSRRTTPRSRGTPSSTNWSTPRGTVCSGRSTPTGATRCSAGTPTSSPRICATTTLAMLVVLRSGGFTTGGLNFDAKLRRQSTDPSICSTPTSAAWTPSPGR
jgi:xylose isomerase